MEALEGFWDDSTSASKIQKEKSILIQAVSKYDKVQTMFDDFEALCEFADEGDAESLTEALATFDGLKESLEVAEQQALMSKRLIPIMRLSPLTLEQVERSPVIGQACSLEC